jgi:hypothetical protein
VWLHTVAPLVGAVTTASEVDGFHVRSPTAPLMGSASEPRLAIGPAGDAAVVWRRAAAGATFIEASVRSADGAWRDEAEPLNPPPGGSEPEVHITPMGEVISAWNQQTAETFGVAIATRRQDSLTFDKPIDAFDVLSPPVQFTNDPVIASNSSGDVLITWYQSTGEQLRTFVSERREPDGMFSRPDASMAISPPGTDVEDPVVDIDDDGRAVVAWRQLVGGGASAIFVATRDSAGNWEVPSSTNDSFSAPADEAWDVRVALTDDGHLFLVWEEVRGDDLAIVAAHRDADGKWLASGQNPMRLSSTIASVDPVLAVGRRGHVVVGWTELAPSNWASTVRRTSTLTTATEEQARWLPAERLSSSTSPASEVVVAVGGDGDRVAVGFVQGTDVRLSLMD